MKIFLAIVLSILMFGTSSVSASRDQEKNERIKGEMIPWEQVNDILPKYTKFTVRDLETGKEFKVQRRAGSQHADVQPLTSKDTKIMKEIYHGKWSWKRRAIVVLHDQKKIAASMHGMPHGVGALKNNFPGHFCIHFYGSKTHRSNFMDLSHKLMILKAAGMLEKHLQTADPYEVTSAFIAGIKERDETIINLVSLEHGKDWNKLLSSIENVSIINMPMLPEEDLTNEWLLIIPIEVDWYVKKYGRKTFRGSIQLARFSSLDGWKVDTKKFMDENGFERFLKRTDKVKNKERAA
ncbi:hypothetical protein [Bacillus dakarensis]|uniref:hypothetical protein n=1 Tax=Robertmurraya dakarensis TaxID=1926278 RepID=UPI000981B326